MIDRNTQASAVETPMSQVFELRKPTTTFEHESTLVATLELSGKSWLISAALPGIDRRPKKTVRVGDIDAVMAILSGWREAAARAGKDVIRVVVGYEAGRDGFWIARELIALGIEVYVMQAASIPVDRRHRRAKTDRIDQDRPDRCGAPAAEAARLAAGRTARVFDGGGSDARG